MAGYGFNPNNDNSIFKTVLRKIDIPIFPDNRKHLFPSICIYIGQIDCNYTFYLCQVNVKKELKQPNEEGEKLKDLKYNLQNSALVVKLAMIHAKEMVVPRLYAKLKMAVGMLSVLVNMSTTYFDGKSHFFILLKKFCS